MTVTRIRPVPHPFSAGELARRADPVGYAHGLAAGHAEALDELRPLIGDVLGDLRYARRQRNRSHREFADYAVWAAVADRHAAHLIGLLAVARALKAMAA